MAPKCTAAVLGQCAQAFMSYYTSASLNFD